MQSPLIVVPVDEVPDVKTKVLKVSILIGTNLLLFQRSKEALAVSVIAGPARSANARHHSMIPQRAQVLGVCILRASI